VWITPRPVVADGLRLRAEGDADTLRALAVRAWPLTRLGDAYSAFSATFTVLGDFLRSGGALSELDALIARVLLIHEYRRIVLRDPLLPAVVLPPDWPGNAARDLCAEVYRALLVPSESWLDGHAIDDSGAALPANRLIFERFSD
jgi:phenylacetic acid degradation operon negative regulatory protein